MHVVKKIRTYNFKNIHKDCHDKISFHTEKVLTRISNSAVCRVQYSILAVHDRKASYVLS